MVGMYIVIGIFIAVIFYRGYKWLSKWFRLLYARINWKLTKHKQQQIRFHVNTEILANSIKFVEKNYLH